MSVLPVKDFFSNKVNIQLKSGQRFEGLLASINYANSSVVLLDVEDLGNEHDKHTIPHDKKITEKVFEAESISEIFLKEKHFSEPKKYKKEEFWDAISEPQANPAKKYKPKYEEGAQDYKPKRNYNNNNGGYDRNQGGYERNQGQGGYEGRNNNNRRREDRPYEPRPQRDRQQVRPEDRDLR